MPRNLDIALLRAFDAVVAAGGITAAARLLNLTQAAVSLQLKRLEENFGCRLVERHRAGIRLTPQGERLIGQARHLLHQNDEVWASMKAPAFAGEVRLGMPSDLVRPFGTPVLRRFDRAWPQVRVTIVCDTSGRLLEQLDRREIDLAIVVQPDCAAHGETLRIEPLAWVGARNGTAHLREPLPLSTGDETCPHRPIALKALAAAARDWRFVCEVASFEAICAPVEADIAVSPMLPSTIPDALEALKESAGLPPLADFYVNLYLPRAGATDIASELARQIRELHAE
ncbi:LysR family transcriptional regulator [Bosea sp. BH3]|uniref:LysR family transcriptional regulator n=1 Tax=Bosea sp. BH3 TaxID=2871701 RepID=UPI0021CAEBC4|nr:LysR family transcriptional regulator [Bosea sp. BH3]MCU4178882.1 LysR family transcriptional regulator [Bosea sp. BH3]